MQIDREDLAKGILRDRIKERRERLGLSLADAAARAGMDARNFDRLLKGSPASLDRLQQVARALDVEFTPRDLQLEAEEQALQLNDIAGEMKGLLESLEGRPALEKMRVLRSYLTDYASQGGVSALTPSSREAISKIATLMSVPSDAIVLERSDDGYRFVRADEIPPKKAVGFSYETGGDFRHFHGTPALLSSVVELLNPNASILVDGADGKVLWALRDGEWTRAEKISSYQVDPFLGLNERLLARYQQKLGLGPKPGDAGLPNN